VLSGDQVRLNKSGRNRKAGSPYHATVQTYPVWRIGGRRLHETRGAHGPRAANESQTVRRATASRTMPRRGHKAQSFNLVVSGWLDEVQTAIRRPRYRCSQARSQARLGHSPKERPALHTAILAPVQKAWQVGGYTAINILFLAAVGWILFWFFSNEQFYVYHIDVLGNRRVSTEAIVAASGLQNYSIFWLNPHQVARQVSATLPPVRSVQVRYGLPNRVTLIVEEQGGQVMWQIGGVNYWVDDDGRLHPVLGEATPALIVQDIRPGVPDAVDPQAVLAAQQLIALLPEIKTLGYAPTTGLRFRHPRGWEVYLGTDEMARKVNILRVIEQQFAGEDTPQPSLVDLRFPESPYYRLPDENGA